jgi:mannose-6-phosphate isomerase
LFGHYPGKVFPLLTKILDANRDLSVQVHPDDAYARENENGELGKTECWYIIDCKEDAELIYGHHAQSKEEFMRWVEEGKWDSLLRKVPIHPGDFFYVPSGTIHALCEGTLVLETQQSSDTTYRVYDYDRTDDHGNKRELHLQKAIDVTMIPHRDAEVRTKTEEKPGVVITTFAKETFFSVYKWEVSGQATFTQDKPFLLASILDGAGTLKAGGASYPLEKGMHFLLPAGLGDFEIEGRLSMIVSHP